MIEYFRLTTPDDELTGTPGSLRPWLRGYQAGGGSRFYITGPYASPPPCRRPEDRRGPVLDERICAKCFHRWPRHLGFGSPYPDATACEDCTECVNPVLAARREEVPDELPGPDAGGTAG